MTEHPIRTLSQRAVLIDHQIQPGARAEVDQMELVSRRLPNGGEQGGAATNFVGLGEPGATDLDQLLLVVEDETAKRLVDARHRRRTFDEVGVERCQMSGGISHQEILDPREQDVRCWVVIYLIQDTHQLAVVRDDLHETRVEGRVLGMPTPVHEVGRGEMPLQSVSRR